MAVAVAVVVRRSDSKLYPEGGVLPERERWRAIRLAHRAVCRDRLSYRAAQQALADAGIRRSLGQLHHDVASYVCSLCEDGPPRPARQPPAAAPPEPARAAGWAGPAPAPW